MKKFLLITLTVSVVLSCSKNLGSDPVVNDQRLQFRVEEAPEWTALFRRSQGWFGGDGIFAIPFSGNDFMDSSADDSVLFVFSDTMVGEIINGKLTPGYKMINNSVMILQGEEPLEDKANFLVNRDKSGAPRTLFVPKTLEAQEGDYYWLGDGFVSNENGNLYLFAYRIRNTNTKDDFPFREVGNTLLVVPQGSQYPFEDYYEIDLSLSDYDLPGHTSFGVGVLNNSREAGAHDPDGFVYVYGIRGGNKELVAARTKPESVEDVSGWEFWNGTGWSENVNESEALSDSVSNELSVSSIGDGRYALVYQYGGIFPTIYMQIGETPVGPFGPRLKVWETTDYLEDKDLFSYNAKAHPAISRPGELIVSYNVNSFKFFEVIERMPNLYRPRFVRIVFEESKE